jgi:hypothetical protein
MSLTREIVSARISFKLLSMSAATQWTQMAATELHVRSTQTGL